MLAGSLIGFGQQRPASNLESVLADAQRAQAAGDYAAAANDLKQAVRLQPAVPQIWANLGLMQHETGDISGAMASFQHAVRLDPSLYVPNLFLGIDYAHSGNAQQAIPFLIKAEKLNKTDAQAPLALGRAYVGARRYSAAAQALDRAIDLNPLLGAAWFTRGIARLDQVEDDSRTMSEEGSKSPYGGALFAESLFKQGRFSEAASLYKTMLDSQSQPSEQPPCIRSERGFALLRAHDSEDAAAEFESERAAHPACGLALLGQARLALDRTDNAQATKLLKDLWGRDHGFVESNAQILLEGMPGEKASAAVDALCGAENQELPSDLRSVLLTAFGQQAQDPAESNSSHDSAAKADASPATADRLYTAGQFAQCAHRLESIHSALSPSQLQLLAACSYFTGDNEQASRAAAALRARQSNSLAGLYWSILANERLAFQSLARFQQLEPNSAKNHILLGDIYHQLERQDDAQAEYMKALALAPGDPAAMLGLATAYLSNNNSQGAMELAQAALLHDPEDPELNLIMAEALMDQHQYGDAVPYLQKSLHAKSQTLPRIHALIGKAYAETGQTQQAIEELKLGASSDEDGSVQYLLVRIYRQLGDAKDANEALNRMKTIKEQRAARGYKQVQDPDLAPLDSSADQASAP